MLCSRNTFWPVATPLSSFFDLDSDVDRFFTLAMHTSDEGRTNHVEPSYRMSSTSTAASVEVELPGVAQDDIDIESTGRSVTIIAKRFDTSIPSDPESIQTKDIPTDENNGKVQTEVVDDTEQDANQDSMSDAAGESADKCRSKQNRPERKPRLEYRLKLHLGPNYDRERITCQSYRNGVLSLHIPTVPAQSPRKITIK